MAKKKDWISVEEQLPPPYARVLVWREFFRGDSGYTDTDYIIKNTTANDCDRPLWNGDLKSWKTRVTHWMPPPKPPVKKEKTDG